jgi:flagellar export protein FliJ
MAKFRLATLLKIRERDRDLAAKAVQDVRLALEKLDIAQQEIDQANRQMNEARKQSSFGAINLHQILDAQRYQMVLSAQSAQIADHKGKLNQELERRQFALVQSQKAVKSLEKLRDQRAQAADIHALARQQDRLDEWSSIRHAMSSIREASEQSSTGNDLESQEHG